MIKLPDDVLKAIADLHSQLVLCNRLNFCSDSLYNLEQTLIRNATAQPKCQKCGDTGMADSGGVQPWGEPIIIDCDCAAAQPVNDGWVSVPIEPTEEMLAAGSATDGGLYCIWKDMLAAAPGGSG